MIVINENTLSDMYICFMKDIKNKIMIILSGRIVNDRCNSSY